MSVETVNELRKFHEYLSEKVSTNSNGLSPEEALDEWRRLHPSKEAFDEDVEAIRESLDEIDRGDRGIPFDEFDRDFSTRHNLPT